MLRVFLTALMMSGCMTTADDPDRPAASTGSNTTAEAGPTGGQIAGQTAGPIAGQTDGQTDGPAADSCDAAPFRRLIGKPDSVFHVMDLPDTVRLIHPGTPVTRDYRPARVNIEIDASGTIVKVWCG